MNLAQNSSGVVFDILTVLQLSIQRGIDPHLDKTDKLNSKTTIFRLAEATSITVPLAATNTSENQKEKTANIRINKLDYANKK